MDILRGGKERYKCWLLSSQQIPSSIYRHLVDVVISFQWHGNDVLWLIYTACSQAWISLCSFLWHSAGFLWHSVVAVWLGKSKCGIYSVPVINAEHFLLLSFLLIYISFLDQLKKSQEASATELGETAAKLLHKLLRFLFLKQPLEIHFHSSTSKFHRDVPSTERFSPSPQFWIRSKSEIAQDKKVSLFFFFFSVKGLIWDVSRELFLFCPLLTYICRVLTYFAKNFELGKLEPAAFSN